MEFNNILLTKVEGIGIININRPKALNALNYETMLELKQLVEDIAKDTTVRVVIITGSGDKAFVAGADVKEMQSMTTVEARNWGRLGQEVFSKIENLPQPVIAAVNGFALGGGCELAMACDIRIASDKAKFGLPEVSLGITPGFSGTQRLPRLVGRAAAKELLFTCDMIDAATAFRLGLVNKVVAPEDLLDTAKALAGKIVTRAPQAVQLCKSAINNGMNMDTQSAYAYEAEVFSLCFSTQDQKEGMSAFSEKRVPKFTGI